MRSMCRMLALMVLLAIPAAARGQGAFYDVYVFDFEYSINRPGEGPIENVVLPVGNRVRWILLDDFHNTISCEGQAIFWEMPISPAGETFEVFFDIPGVYTYFCSPHGFDNGDGTATGMQGTVTVLDVPGPGAVGVIVMGGVWAVGRRKQRRFAAAVRIE